VIFIGFLSENKKAANPKISRPCFVSSLFSSLSDAQEYNPASDKHQHGDSQN
jgi:hypothetical protein